MNYQLASAILKNKWAIELQFAMNSAGLVADILAGNVDVQDRAEEENKPLAVSIDGRRNNHFDGGYTYWDWDDAPEGSVALIRLQGSLMKNTQSCGPVGMAVIGERFREADKNPNFAGILLHIDSPGGTVDGTQTLADIVKNTRKPVVAFVDGLMASAALWVGSSANEVWASTADDEVGSVGVLMSFMDIQPYWESLGVKFHTVTASQSTDKVKMWEDLRSGKYDEYRKEFLDPIAQSFIDSVKQNRPGVSDEHLTGRLYLAKNSIGVFVDRIGKFEAAIDRVYQLSEENQAHSRNGSGQAAQHYSPKTTVMKQFKHVNAALGVESLEAVDQVVSLNEQQLEAIDNALAADNSAPLQAELDSANQTIAQRDTTIAGLQGQLSSANADVAQRDATITQLNQQVKDLKGEAADPGALAHKTTDGNPSAGKAIADKHENPFDALDEISQEYLGKKLND
jgi:protease-4